MSTLALESRELSKAYGKLLVTDQVSLRIEPNELRAIIGPNGAGKTSLVAQIAGETAPDSGSLSFFGQTLDSLTVPQRRRLGISRTFQITSLLPNFSAHENVRLAVQSLQMDCRAMLRDATADGPINNAASALLERVGLDRRGAVPVRHLAHGEQRQLEIAVALAGSPRLLLLDEPTAGMGSDDTLRIKDLISSLKGKHTIILIEHDMPTVFALADRVTVLVNGREIATDRPDVVRPNEQVRASYLGDDDA